MNESGRLKFDTYGLSIDNGKPASLQASTTSLELPGSVSSVEVYRTVLYLQYKMQCILLPRFDASQVMSEEKSAADDFMLELQYCTLCSVHHIYCTPAFLLIGEL